MPAGAASGCRPRSPERPAVMSSTTWPWLTSLALHLRGHLPEVQARDVVGHREDVVHVVGDEDDGEPVVGQPPDEVEHLLGLGDAQRGGRLVEDHELAVPQHRPRDRHGLALAAGQARHVLAHRPQRAHREALEGLVGALLHGRLVQRDPGLDLAAEEHVVHHVEVVAQGEVLVDDLDAQRVGLLRPGDVDRLALPEELAALERVDADDRLDQRALAGAVVADERGDLTQVAVEVDVAQDVDRRRSSC